MVFGDFLKNSNSFTFTRHYLFNSILCLFQQLVKVFLIRYLKCIRFRIKFNKPLCFLLFYIISQLKIIIGYIFVFL